MTTMASVLQAATDATEEVCSTVLNLDMVVPDDPASSVPRNDHRFVSVALVSDHIALQVGLVAEEDTCGVMTRSLLGMEPEEELADQDVTDSVGEVVNILAGSLKTRLNGAYPALKLGLPVWSIGYPDTRQTSKLVVGSQPLTVGGNPVLLTIMVMNKAA